MSNQIINNSAFLRTSRDFPEEMHLLARETNKAYIDIAAQVNDRIIGFFSVNRPSVTGEGWYLTGNQKQQTLRQVYNLTAVAGAFASVNHGITVISPTQFIRCFGSYTDATDSYGLIFGSNVAIAGQISFYVTSAQIIFLAGAGAPTPTQGIVILEWLNQP